MVFIILLALLLFFYWCAVVAEGLEFHRETKRKLQELSELNEVLNQQDLQNLKNKEQNTADQKLSEYSPGSLNMTQQDQYKEYQKRGGIDDYPTFLQKNELHELFP